MIEITEFVADMLKDATESELIDIIEKGPELEDCDMREALENEFLSQAKELLERQTMAHRNELAAQKVTALLVRRRFTNGTNH